MSNDCAVTGLFHVPVKTNDLPQTLAFYKNILGLREAKRPPFGFPGAWLACSTPTIVRPRRRDPPSPNGAARR